MSLCILFFFVRIVLSLYKLPPRFAVRNWFGTRDCNPRRNIRWSSWRRRRVGVRRAPYRASVRPGRCCRYLAVLSSRVLFSFLIVYIAHCVTWTLTQETTARLLFMAVRWVRCLPPFQTISKDDQLLLLERSWTQLFLLHLAQWSISWDITALLEDEQVRSRLPTDDNPTNQELVLIQVYRLYPSARNKL